MALLKHETGSAKEVEPASTRFDRSLDRLFDDWLTAFPFRRPGSAARWASDDVIHVEEFHENGTLVVRADLPGIDPEKDVELTVSGGVLHLAAERREEESTEERGYVRRELRYGRFTRSLPLPQGVSEDQVTASYHDGILEVRIPSPPTPEAKKVPVTRS